MDHKLSLIGRLVISGPGFLGGCLYSMLLQAFISYGLMSQMKLAPFSGVTVREVFMHSAKSLYSEEGCKNFFHPPPNFQFVDISLFARPISYSSLLIEIFLLLYLWFCLGAVQNSMLNLH